MTLAILHLSGVVCLRELRIARATERQREQVVWQQPIKVAPAMQADRYPHGGRLARRLRPGLDLRRDSHALARLHCGTTSEHRGRQDGRTDLSIDEDEKQEYKHEILGS